MVPVSSPEWLIEVGGKKAGPFTLEQIEQLLRSQQILPQQKLTHVTQKEKTLTVQELLALPRVPQPPSRTGPFQPPPRPTLPQREFPVEPSLQNAEPDPAMTLFDALQVARDRSQANRNAPIEPSVPSAGRREIAFTPLILIGGAALIGAILWGIIQVTQSRPEPSPIAEQPKATPSRAASVIATHAASTASPAPQSARPAATAGPLAGRALRPTMTRATWVPRSQRAAAAAQPASRSRDADEDARERERERERDTREQEARDREDRASDRQDSASEGESSSKTKEKDGESPEGTVAPVVNPDRERDRDRDPQANTQ